MNTSKPPFLAAWLLDRFGADPQIESIAGDLLEQYRLGRSSFWYWREVIRAIIVGIWSGFRNDKLSVMRALVIGWIVLYAGMALWEGPIDLFSRIFPQADSGPWLLPFLLINGPWCALTGWTVAQCAPASRIPAVLAFAVSFLSFVVLLNIEQIRRLSLALLRVILMVPEEYFDYAGAIGSLAFQTVLATLILLGGGLLTGPPKRSMLAPPGTPLDESSES
jgi:hypothetical protein